jgi:ribosome-associated protein
MSVIKNILKSRDWADLTAQLADSRKAEHITLIELAGSSDMTDWFVICQGDNPAHNRAIADAIVDGLKNMKMSAWHVEGLTEGRWIVLDYSDVVVHIMLSSVREYYAIEELWPKAKALRMHFPGDGDHAW